MKVKEMSEDDPNIEEVVPIPVQIFLWRQTAPFVRPRLGKVHDSACMVIIKFYSLTTPPGILNRSCCKRLLLI